MNGRRAKQRRRQEQRLAEQRQRTVAALDNAIQAASAKVVGDQEQRVVIVEGSFHDDVLVVPKTNEEQELNDARKLFAEMYGGEEIKSMVRMVGRSEPEGKERQA